MSVATFTKTGTKATTAAKLPKDIFGVDVKNHDLLKQAYVAYQTNGRTNNAKTLTRGLVRGGGRKPWKQKGTGRARFGSIRVPIWRGGGITFGPTGAENFNHAFPQSAKKQALRQALTVAAEANKVHVLETFECKDGKVAATKKLIDKMGLTGSILLVVSEKDALVQRATNNLSGVKAVQARYLNVFDVMNADNVVVTEKSLTMIQEWLAAAKKEGTK